MNSSASPPDFDGEPDRCPDCGWVLTKPVDNCPQCGCQLVDRCPGCGGRPAGWHWASCPIRFGKPLPPEPVIRAELIGKIRAVCNELDSRYGNEIPGTAERGLYSFHWPPSESGIHTLCALLDQAREYLRRAPALPASACPHAAAPRKSKSRPGRASLARGQGRVTKAVD